MTVLDRGYDSWSPSQANLSPFTFPSFRRVLLPIRDMRHHACIIFLCSCLSSIYSIIKKKKNILDHKHPYKCGGGCHVLYDIYSGRSMYVQGIFIKKINSQNRQQISTIFFMEKIIMYMNAPKHNFFLLSLLKYWNAIISTQK